MKDQQVCYSAPLVLGYESHEILFYLVGVVVKRESKSLGKSADMRVYCNSFEYAVGILQNNVSGFACDSW